MKKINNKGFTLVEVLAVIVILGMLVAIIVPNVSTLINKNKQENIKQISTSIKNAAKLYISDYKYSISVTGTCTDESSRLNIKENSKTNPITTFTDSKIFLSTLIDEGNLTTSKDGNIYNPVNKEQKLNLDTSYVIIKYSCKTKDYIYNDPHLEWQ